MRHPGAVIAATIAIAAVVLVVAYDAPPKRPDIPFAPAADTTLADPDNPAKPFRIDFARVEAEHPLSAADLARLTPENLKTLSQEEIDQIYGRLTAGPIPDGVYRGGLFFPRGEDGRRSRLREILGGFFGLVADHKIDRLERIGSLLWKGKVFDRDRRILRNQIEDLKLLEALIDEPDKLEKITVPRSSLLRFILPDTDVFLLFPAKLYCGQSLLDGRRESVIIDYLFSDDIAGYQPGPDSLAGRGGLKVRDEIRMVRPGFYLGRAYINKVFLLNFTLYNPEVADNAADMAEDCWPGEQVRRTAAQ